MALVRKHHRNGKGSFAWLPILSEEKGAKGEPESTTYAVVPDGMRERADDRLCERKRPNHDTVTVGYG
jgi:hypothetical protein